MTQTLYDLTISQRATYRQYAQLALPRHTSYPIAPVWRSDYGTRELREDLARSSSERRELSLYVHVPFCEQLCYYCACTKEIVSKQKRSTADPSNSFIDSLAMELERFGECVGDQAVGQVHLGGGSPTFLTPEQLSKLFGFIRRRFQIDTDAEIAIEVDPRITSVEHLATLKSLGFNRISLGVQDFDPTVQAAVNRKQPFDLVAEFMNECRAAGFESINFDLIYGLPYQTLETMANTINKTISLAPDRIAFYRLAVIPEIFRWQNTFARSDLPSGDLSLDMNMLAIREFEQVGYEFIGLDHFAKPEESLSSARDDGTLHRTFQGMATGKQFDVIGTGPSGITQLTDAFSQNVKTSQDWHEAVQNDLATSRGMRLCDDDKLRRELMQQLYGHGHIPKRPLERQFSIDFDSYFKDELSRLSELVDQGVVIEEPDSIRLTNPLGRLLVRVVAAVFDRYLPPTAFREGLSDQPSSKVG